MDSGNVDGDASFAHKTAPLFRSINTITRLTGFENLKSLQINLDNPASHYDYHEEKSLFTDQKVQVAFCNMVNALGPGLDYLSLSNGIGSDQTPIEPILRQIKLKGIRDITLGWSWGLENELIDQLEDCGGTLKGPSLGILHPTRGKDEKLWCARLFDLRETLGFEYLDDRFYPVSKCKFFSHIPPGMIAHGIRIRRPRDESTRWAWKRKVVLQVV